MWTMVSLVTDASVLTPPDFERCQCEIRPAHGPFVLGPRPPYSRCERRPVWLAVETKPGEDGLHGSMTLCQSCAEVMLESADLRARTQLQPIHQKETA